MEEIQIIKVNVGQNVDRNIGIKYSGFITNDLTMECSQQLEVLKKVVKENIPFVDHKDVRTTKEIVWFWIYKCPCCQTSIGAVVDVYCEGVTDIGDWDKVEGLYKVGIDAHSMKKSDNSYSEFSVSKMIGKKISGEKPSTLNQSRTESKKADV